VRIAKFINDPRFFSAVIVVLFAMATIRWIIEGNLRQSLYWGGGFILNFAVTFLEE
jgi:hypothetical protein